jgi:hypothetical protein
MGQMMPSEPSNILFWTYQDMMEWMSRTSEHWFKEMACADVDFGLEVGQMWLMILVQAPTPALTQHNTHGPDDAFRTIKHPLLDISGHDGMDEQDRLYFHASDSTKPNSLLQCSMLLFAFTGFYYLGVSHIILNVEFCFSSFLFGYSSWSKCVRSLRVSCLYCGVTSWPLFLI